MSRTIRTTKFLTPDIDTVQVPDEKYGTRTGTVRAVTEDGVSVQIGWQQVGPHRSEPVIAVFDPDVVKKIYQPYYPGHGCDMFSMCEHYCELPEGHDWDTPWQDREHMIRRNVGTEWETEYRWTYRRQIKEIEKHSSRFD